MTTAFVKGHQLYYNLIKPHEGLNGYTPAHFANIYLDLGNEKWKKLVPLPCHKWHGFPPREKNAFGVLSVLPCDSSLNINVGDFSLGFTLILNSQKNELRLRS